MFVLDAFKRNTQRLKPDLMLGSQGSRGQNNPLGCLLLLSEASREQERYE